VNNHGKEIINGWSGSDAPCFCSTPVSAAVCPNPDCPNSDCEPKDYNWQGTKDAGQQTVSGVCPNPDCTPNDYQYLSPGRTGLAATSEFTVT